MGNYITSSIDLHLFFARIMKEHSLFLEAAFQKKDSQYIERARWFQTQFEGLLEEVLKISDGNVDCQVLKSREIVTDFTLPAENMTEKLTGIPINSCITLKEQQLRPSNISGCTRELKMKISKLNQRAICLVRDLTQFKEEILREVSSCRLYTANYPLLIQHIIREAKLYHSFLMELENRGGLSSQSIRTTEMFWNQIMMEHALFIRGLLDPTEAELIAAADGFAGEYEELLLAARNQSCKTMDELTRKTIEETMKYRDFKAAGTKGITECNVSSVILPLLADHVLREANHYLRILQDNCDCYEPI